MIVYVEGVDGSGKTTLVNALYKRLKESGYLVDINDELSDGTHPASLSRFESNIVLLARMIDLISDEVIHLCDRGPLSDIIYRTFDEYKPILEFKDLLNLKNMTKNSKFIIILCDTNMSEELMLARGDNNLVAINKHRELRYLYKQFTSVLNVKKYDLYEHNIDEFINKIIALLEENNEC